MDVYYIYLELPPPCLLHSFDAIQLTRRRAIVTKHVQFEGMYSALKLSAPSLSSSDAAATIVVTATVGCAPASVGPAGDEVVQLYTALQHVSNEGKQSIPLRELKGFTRVSLPACTAKEGSSNSGSGSVDASSVVVQFELSAEDLALVDADGTVRAIPGTYDVWVGGVGPGKQGVFVEALDGVGGGGSAAQRPLHATLSVTK